MVQESLTNVMRHTAPPTRTEVRVEWSTEAVEVTVDDDGGGGGAGLDSAAVPASGRGLLGLADRVAQVGGRFTSGRRPDGGWRTHATLPLAPPRPAADAARNPRPSMMMADTPAHPIRVAIADDQALIRSAISVMIEVHADLELVGEASDGGELLELARAPTHRRRA